MNYTKTLKQNIFKCFCFYNLFLDTVYFDVVISLKIFFFHAQLGFNDTIFRHFVNELEHCDLNMQIDLQLLIPVFLCYSTA